METMGTMVRFRPVTARRQREAAWPEQTTRPTPEPEPEAPWAEATGALLELDEDTLAELAAGLGDADLDWLVFQHEELRRRADALSRVRRVLNLRLVALLELRNDGEKAVHYGTVPAEDGQQRSYQVEFKPGIWERAWVQERLAAFVERLGTDARPAVAALAAKHFRSEWVCRNIRYAKAAIAPLGGELAAEFAGCYAETRKPPTVAIAVEVQE